MKKLLASILLTALSAVSFAAGIGSQGVGENYQDVEGNWSVSNLVLLVISFGVSFWLALHERSPLGNNGWLRVFMLFCGPALTLFLLVYLFR